MRLCVYTGSRHGRSPAYADAAAGFGALLARQGIGLVYGGGHIGLMGVIADAALAAGGEVIGVIPHKLLELELAHRNLAELIVVSSMHDRKARMANLSDAFVALPGGIGTLEELFEIWTWTQLGYHSKPCGLLDVEGYYEPLTSFLNAMVEEGFLKPEDRAMLISDSDPVRLLQQLRNPTRPASDTSLTKKDL